MMNVSFLPNNPVKGQWRFCFSILILLIYVIYVLSTASQIFKITDILIYGLFVAAVIVAYNSGRQVDRRLGFVLAVLITICFGWLSLVLAYCIETNGPISRVTMEAILQTDDREAVDYALENFVSFRHALFFLMGGFIAACCLRLSTFAPGWMKGHKAVALLVVSAVMLCFIPTKFRVVRDFNRLKREYKRELAVLADLSARLAQGGELSARKSGGSGLHVIVIGESANRDRMQAYGYHKPTTPWLERMKGDPGMHLFTQSYSSHVNTVQCVLAAMERGNSYDGMLFPTSETLIGYSRAAGMKTVWLSNQTRLTRMGTPITALADTAETVIFTNLGTGPVGPSQSDFNLLGPFVQILDEISEDESALIVIHLVGSHFPYRNRIRDLADWIDPEAVTGMTDYEKSLRLTDDLLSRLHEILRNRKEQPVTMIYLSDHGEDPGNGGHNADLFTWPMARIPFFVWLSDRYQRENPHKQDTLKNHTDRVFTNDLLFDLYTGLADIDFAGRESKWDIGHPSYALTREQAATLHGAKPLQQETR